MEDEKLRMLREIAEKRGSVPGFHRTLIEEDPEFYKVYEKMASCVYTEERHLSRKVKELLFTGVLVAMRAGREHIMLHIKAALDCGASKAEILEAIELAYLPSGVVSLMNGLEAYREVVLEQSQE
jgi:alkylhydroperoxidase/carboxymuconolactone decarboxylase family protein YurZ